MGTNITPAICCVQAPAAFPKLLQFWTAPRKFPVLTVQPRPRLQKGSELWSKADLDSNSLQLRVLYVTFPKQLHKSLINSKLIFPVKWNTNNGGECISPPTQLSWCWSVIYFVLDFSFLFCCQSLTLSCPARTRTRVPFVLWDCFCCWGAQVHYRPRMLFVMESKTKKLTWNP